MKKIAVVAILIMGCSRPQQSASSVAAVTPSTVAIAATAVPTSPPRFDYQIYTVPDGEAVARLNADGAVGWELVSARRVTQNDPLVSMNNGGTMQYEFIMKRLRR